VLRGQSNERIQPHPAGPRTIFTDFDCAEENARQAKLVSFPEGFHEVIAADGKALGFGFFCSRCKLHFPANAPKVVRHCGKESKFPELPDGLIKMVEVLLQPQASEARAASASKEIYFNV